jgi:signal transduction histidine kinase
MISCQSAFLIAFLCLLTSCAFAQEQAVADSLERVYLEKPHSDQQKLELLSSLSFNEMKDLRKGLKYADELIRLSDSLKNNNYLRAGYFLKGNKERSLGRLDHALDLYFKSAEIARKSKDSNAEGESYGAIADVYSIAKNHKNSVHYYLKAIQVLRHSKDSISLASVLSNAGDEYFNAEQYDSALVYFKQARFIFDKTKYLSGTAYSLGNIGMVYAHTGKDRQAEQYINQAIRMFEKTQNYYPICDYLLVMAGVYSNKGEKQIAKNYILKSLNLAEKYGLTEQVAKASLKMSTLSEQLGDTGSAFAYYKKHIAYRDRLNNVSSVQKMGDLRTNYEVSQKQAEVNMLTQQKRNQKYLTISLGVILGLTVLFIGVLIKNNQLRKRAYTSLNAQKQETEKQKSKAEAALRELQITQKKLIHSAKMASLGELSAGIAHEIQNPLNFVNNFSELNVDLLNDLKDGFLHELPASSQAEAALILDDLASNLKRITDHGKRADSIVKGMLQHSRAVGGRKELTDINALANEYLILSFQGMKLKDKGFNARYETNFDERLGHIRVVPQDIASVLLNLYSNAFFAVKEKKEKSSGAFDPLVTVTTRQVGDKVEISIKDNGLGIREDLQEKIFQPFFTTKPPGQGTGLGLSLSYDIIMAHGGEIKLETQQGEFTQFTVQLPMDPEPGSAV